MVRRGWFSHFRFLSPLGVAARRGGFAAGKEISS